MNGSKDFEELFGCLMGRNARFLVVGAHAVAFHAKPRFTKDLDVWIEPTPDNADRVLKALDDFGFGSLALSIEDFTAPGRIVQLGFPPNRIDLLTSIQGVTFEEAWAGRAPGRYGNTEVFYIGKDELIRNKAAVGRPQDRMDLSWLTEKKPRD